MSIGLLFTPLFTNLCEIRIIKKPMIIITIKDKQIELFALVS